MEKGENKEFNSTITDLKILCNLALYHSRRIPAAVSYNLFERTRDVSVLDDAIAYERTAIEAWRQLVNAAGDVYSDDLKMGVRTADLCGHWKDELIALEKGLKTLEQKRADLKAESPLQDSPHYRAATSSTNEQLFTILHQPVTSSPVGQPIVVNIKVGATSGVKWVHLLYRNVNQEMEYQTVQMLPSAGKDNYQAIVPVDKINPKWDVMYLIEVMDNNGKGITYPDFNKETPYRIVSLIR